MSTLLCWNGQNPQLWHLEAPNLQKTPWLPCWVMQACSRGHHCQDLACRFSYLQFPSTNCLASGHGFSNWQMFKDDGRIRKCFTVYITKIYFINMKMFYSLYHTNLFYYVNEFFFIIWETDYSGKYNLTEIEQMN